MRQSLLNACAGAAAMLAAGLSGPAVAADLPVYIPLGDADRALIVDPDTDAVVGAVEDLPNVHGLSVSRNGRVLLAGSLDTWKSGDTAMDKPAGMSPDDHAAHHSGGSSAKAAGDRIGLVSVVDPDAGEVVRRIEVPGAVHHVAVAPDGAFAVVTHPVTGRISVVDPGGFKVAAEVAIGSNPNYAVVLPDGDRVYVTAAGAGTVSEIDADSWRVVREFKVGASPEHLVLSPDAGRLFVNNVADGTVNEIDLAAGEVSRTFDVGGALHGIDISSDGATLYVAAVDAGEVVAIDLSTGMQRRARMPASPYHLARVRPGKLYVSSAEVPRIWAVDAETLERTGVIAVDGTGHQIAVPGS